MVLGNNLCEPEKKDFCGKVLRHASVILSFVVGTHSLSPSPTRRLRRANTSVSTLTRTTRSRRLSHPRLLFLKISSNRQNFFLILISFIHPSVLSLFVFIIFTGNIILLLLRHTLVFFFYCRRAPFSLFFVRHKGGRTHARNPPAPRTLSLYSIQLRPWQRLGNYYWVDEMPKASSASSLWFTFCPRNAPPSGANGSEEPQHLLHLSRTWCSCRIFMFNLFF